MRRFLFPLVFGLAGCAVLIALGLWQLRRLEWKDALIAEIATRMAAAPGPLPQEADPEEDRFRPVVFEGSIAGLPLTVLVSAPVIGPAFRVIAPVRTTDERRVLVDLGVVPAEAPIPHLPETVLRIEGHLHWPQERDFFTPDPEGDLWFVRDVDSMSATVGTERLMVVADAVAPELPVTPWPLEIAGISNDHLEYAITWFGLAVAWAGMAVLMVVRRRREP